MPIVRVFLHRDIKPSNIVLDKDDVPYLADFGLARIAQAGESTMSADMILGTPQYISPEQARGEKNINSRTDLYSLGVILYEMVVGRVPFNADTPYAIVHDHIYTDLPLPSKLNPDIPEAVERVLLKALAKNPSDRYSSANEMIDAFRRATAESGLTALDPKRDLLAEENFNAQDNLPTITGALPPAASIPAPVPPRSPQPPRTGKKEVQVGAGPKVEMQFDFSDMGRKVEQGIEKGARYIEAFAEKVEGMAKEVKIPISEEARIRQRIEKRYKERQGLITNVTAYVLISIMLWSIWFFTSQSDFAAIERGGEFPFPWPIFPFLGWGIGVFAHAIEYYSKYGGGASRREEAIQREIELERERSGYLEKPKNDRRMRLTEDGELEEVTDDNVSQSAKRKRR